MFDTVTVKSPLAVIALKNTIAPLLESIKVHVALWVSATVGDTPGDVATARTSILPAVIPWRVIGTDVVGLLKFAAVLTRFHP